MNSTMRIKRESQNFVSVAYAAGFEDVALTTVKKMFGEEWFYSTNTLKFNCQIPSGSPLKLMGLGETIDL